MGTRMGISLKNVLRGEASRGALEGEASWGRSGEALGEGLGRGREGAISKMEIGQNTNYKNKSLGLGMVKSCGIIVLW